MPKKGVSATAPDWKVTVGRGEKGTLQIGKVITISSNHARKLFATRPGDRGIRRDSGTRQRTDDRSDRGSVRQHSSAGFAGRYTCRARRARLGRCGRVHAAALELRGARRGNGSGEDCDAGASAGCRSPVSTSPRWPRSPDSCCSPESAFVAPASGSAPRPNGNGGDRDDPGEARLGEPSFPSGAARAGGAADDRSLRPAAGTFAGRRADRLLAHPSRR